MRDDVFGHDLAKSGVYTFRRGGNLKMNLAAEAKKPRANRGTETAAREIRRFLNLAGFIEYKPISTTYNLTLKGNELLKAKNAIEKNKIWREAMLALELEDAEKNKSHPYRILLRLVGDNPGIEPYKLMLALEAKDDSDSEYKRISNLLDFNFKNLINSIEVGESQAKNAVKILPSIARQIGDIIKNAKGLYPSGSIEISEDSIETVSPKSKKKKSAPASGKRIIRAVDSASIASISEFGEAESENSMVDLSSAIELRNKRTKIHNELVKQFVKKLEIVGYNLFEYPFDFLAIKGNTSLLIEVKTLDGSSSDERRQSEKALGQIKGYTHFDLPLETKSSDVIQIILFSKKPSEAIMKFLSNNGTIPIWRTPEAEFELLNKHSDIIIFDPGFFES